MTVVWQNSLMLTHLPGRMSQPSRKGVTSNTCIAVLFSRHEKIEYNFLTSQLRPTQIIQSSIGIGIFPLAIWVKCLVSPTMLLYGPVIQYVILLPQKEKKKYLKCKNPSEAKTRGISTLYCLHLKNKEKQIICQLKFESSNSDTILETLQRLPKKTYSSGTTIFVSPDNTIYNYRLAME